MQSGPERTRTKKKTKLGNSKRNEKRETRRKENRFTVSELTVGQVALASAGPDELLQKDVVRRLAAVANGATSSESERNVRHRKSNVIFMSFKSNTVAIAQIF